MYIYYVIQNYVKVGHFHIVRNSIFFKHTVINRHVVRNTDVMVK
jgi:hypothetical protein